MGGRPSAPLPGHNEIRIPRAAFGTGVRCSARCSAERTLTFLRPCPEHG